MRDDSISTAEDAEAPAKVGRSVRRSAADGALRALVVEIEIRRQELATLERSHDILERSLVEHPDRCECWNLTEPCADGISARWCRDCGCVITRCEIHGGSRAATHAMDEHVASHGVIADPEQRKPAARDPAPADARRLPAGGKAVPVGRVPSPPPARRPRGPEREAKAPYEDRREQTGRRSLFGSSSGLATLSRGRGRSGVD